MTIKFPSTAQQNATTQALLDLKAEHDKLTERVAALEAAIEQLPISRKKRGQAAEEPTT